ncbi:hypothetical protein CASFOL_011801 [Castilleja foliolosa]|uniref:TCP domain-containing protein n=1 Tax=Castilleja foliolosa TaxID=1961234 RepID=A0ABD3DSN3_9LAMI
MNPRDEEATNVTTKQETSTCTSTSTSSWSRSKDPRIVRVSRAFGGKDRHSKVCTVRGLRDRRVRLSVPTAIQLYDLQDRLGLSQPSKVVDWLLNAAKHEIDKLPPLQFPPMMGFQDFAISQSSKQGLISKPNEHIDWTRNVDETTQFDNLHNNNNNNNNNQGEGEQVNDFLARQNYSANPYNSFVKSSWDQTSISLGLTAHHDLHSFGFLQPVPSSGLLQPYFPNNTQFDPNKDSDDFQTSSPELSNTARPFQFSMTANLLPSQNNAVIK